MLDKKNIIIISLLFVLYFLLFPLNPGKNLYLTRGKAIDLLSLNGEAGDNPIPFTYKGWGGFINSDIKSSYTLKIKDGLILTENSYINYSMEDKNIELMDSKGHTLYSIKNSGYPFSIGNRIFIIGRDSKSISELSKGEILWTKKFNSIITTVDGSSEYLVVGLSKGIFKVLDNKGDSYFTYEPGGSRVSIIYSTKITHDGRYIAVVSGLDPQRFILYEKRQNEYKPIFVKNLKDEFRRNVNIFMPEGSGKIFFEGKDTVEILDIGDEFVSSIDSPFGLKEVDYIPEYGLILLHSGARNYNNLKLLTMDNITILNKDYTGEDVSVTTRGNTLFIILDGKAITLDLEDFR